MGQAPEEENYIVGTVSELLARAADHFNKEAFHAAADISRHLLENNPNLDAAWHILGRVALRAYKADIAIDYLSTAVSLAPQNMEYMKSLAFAQQQANLWQAALESWNALDALNSDSSAGNETRETTRFNRALIHLKLGDNDAALALYSESTGPALSEFGDLLLNSRCYEEARFVYEILTKKTPDEFSHQYKMGVSCHNTGDFKGAIDHYRKALAIEPESTQCHQSLCAVYTANGDLANAVEHGEKAVQLAPDSPQSQSNLGIALLQNNEASKALPHLKRAAELTPENPEVLNNLSVAYADTGAVTAAVHWLQKALTLKPDWADALLNLGNAYRRLQQPDEAIKAIQRAVTIEPHNHSLYLSLGLALLNANDPEGAIDCYRKGLELQPDDPELRKGLGIAQLSIGDYSNGWQNYEARLQCMGTAARHLTAPQWRGENINEGSLLVYAEQGFGDTIQFCRYLSILNKLIPPNVRIIFEVQKPLHRLLNQLSGGRCTIVARGEPLPSFDLCVPLLSLPSLVGTTRDNIPADVPYLHCNDGAAHPKIEKGAFNIGLVWAGNPNRQDDDHRSCPASALRPLSNLKHCRFLNLQIGGSETLPFTAADLTDQIGDFGDTAAILRHLDLVLTVDTATAHLAGALGVPVWVMLNYAADWRYQKTRTDSPWYPTMRLFRQTTPGDWGSVIQQVVSALDNAPDRAE